MKKYTLVFVMLMIWTIPVCIEGAEQAEPNAFNPTHNSQKNLGSKVKDKPINKDSDEHKEDSGGISKNGTEDTPMIEAQRLQYTQLLEVHRSYFTIYLQVLAIYLAVMGACLNIVPDKIESMKSDGDGSKTVFFSLIAFAIIASLLFGWGVWFGNVNAGERSGQIASVAKQLKIEQPVNVHLLKKLFLMMFVGTGSIMILWLVVLVRGLMKCAGESTLQGFKAYVKERISRGFKACAK